MKRFLSFLLACLVAALSLSSCASSADPSGILPTPPGHKAEAVHKVEILLPPASPEEQAAGVTAAVAVEGYLVARAYLDELLAYDTASLTEENFGEFEALLNDTMTAFRNSAIFTQCMSEATEAWMEAYEEGPKPTYKVVTEVPGGFSLIPGVHADDGDIPAEEWARDIVAAYDKAPAGKALRTLASQLGTDVKRAYLILQQAQAILEGQEYQKIADKANTCVKVATGLKTAGTAAQLGLAVVAAAPAGALGAVIKTGGVVCNGVNTLLEIGSAGSIIYNNGEDNEISIACDKTEAQFAPVGQIFALAGLGYTLKDIGGAGRQILKEGYKSLTPEQAQSLGENTFSLLSYGSSAYSDYADGGRILSGTFTHTKDGTTFTLFDTMAGDNGTIENMLKNSGFLNHDGTLPFSAPAPSTLKELLEGGYTDRSGTAPGTIPSDMTEKLLDRYAPLTPRGNFDLPSYIQSVEKQTGRPVTDPLGKPGAETTAAPGKTGAPEAPPEATAEPTPEPTAEPTPEPTPELTPKKTPKPTPKPTPKKTAAPTEKPLSDAGLLTGAWSLVLRPALAPVDHVNGTVVLASNNRMEISFGTHSGHFEGKEYVLDDAIGYTAHLVGTYDPATRTFTGQGDGPTDDALTASWWDTTTTTITFSLDGDTPTGTGVMGAGLTMGEQSLACHFTMRKTGEIQGKKPRTLSELEGVWTSGGDFSLEITGGKNGYSASFHDSLTSYTNSGSGMFDGGDGTLKVTDAGGTSRIITLEWVGDGLLRIVEDGVILRRQ